ncbi:hypothetical protein [Pseudoramibacter porci]|jgi:hypothetical protein|uniref:Uncharacterized protein n=2 Tax=Pseudoramibacter TaxID=113286 RepID=A0A6L5GS72_9FIRM|nr:hypothetical protein [Pseudoramibacter porci]MQM73121.1 hypothetical protein [Candidatus Pseudoramibacter fermentans]MSS19541.1 hypothetical protein [Pseudoramibacter porci]RRF92121.1 MAG: hypothetical protein DUD26_07860 [Eubacteriaceae bacterium]
MSLLTKGLVRLGTAAVLTAGTAIAASRFAKDLKQNLQDYIKVNQNAPSPDRNYHCVDTHYTIMDE